MDADWYVDPLGRFEGRYFDGDQWTDQVSDRGVLAVDPDWGRELGVDVEVDVDDVGAGTTDAFSGHVTDDNPVVVSVAADAGSANSTESAERTVDGASTAAVRVDRDYSSESPARQVAVLDAEAETDRATTVVDGVETEPVRRSRGWLWALAALALLAVLALLLLPRIFGGNDSTDVADGSAAVAGADSAADDGDVEGSSDQGDGSGAQSGSDDGQADAAASADDGAGSDDGTTGVDDSTGDAMHVGGYEILNGRPILRDLTEWHRSYADANGVTLPVNTGCWFGTMGNAVVQNAHCGPVRATPGAEPRFDLVPLKFEDVEAGVIQVRPITDAVVPEANLPNELELIGTDGIPVDRYSLADQFELPARGERVPRDSGD